MSVRVRKAVKERRKGIRGAMTFIFNVQSTSGQKFVISVLGPDNTVYDIKEKLEELAGISKDMIMLVYKGSKLDNNSTIAQCTIEAGSTISMVLALRAGASAKRE